MENLKIGIWLDQKQAFLIRMEEGKANILNIESLIEDYHVVGGARSKTPWGPMDNVSESKVLERRKSQLKDYFKRIIQHLKDCEELYLFGPGQTKDKLFKAIQEDTTLKITHLQAEPADKMTQNQMVAQVKKALNIPIDRHQTPQH